MENSNLITSSSQSEKHEEDDELPKARFWDAMDITYWEGFWFDPGLVKPAMTFRSTFTARNDDVLLASTMKTGTTWLKSLALCILRNDDVLATDNPHFHLPTVEGVAYSTKPLLAAATAAPRLLHTHLPYSVLPDSLKTSPAAKIVYIARNPKDTLISMWHFFNSILRPFPLEAAVDCFCSGVHHYGPFFDHVAEYWIESRNRPEKILFLKYEELKNDPKSLVSKIAEFVGKPIGSEDEVEKILWKCSFERLKNLEVNKNGSVLVNVPNKSFFRKGEVGDWKNYLTPEMAERIDQLSRDRHEAIGLFL
ncbi:cytosolic sulfotransferase 12-like [Andrographis paniculata]|uniref:cytosolic sulfotransferase 12-like n=1 Tax=Andrographis paniculata TaxID=175694 RepID=UPI0021E72074|nr:cytosolic sulfotransferase 12-like [Andrographis paniculata]